MSTTTLVDIARETQTSVSTVSRVLSGGALARRISKPTRERVQEVATKLGYRPNLIARSLRTRRSHTVALLVSDIANPFFSQIGGLIQTSLHREGYSLMLGNSGEDPELETEYLQMVAQKSIDGLIVVPLARTKKALYRYIPQNLPLVVLDRPIPGIASSVSSDQDQAARILCDTLQRAGVKRVALISGPHDVVTHRQRVEVISDRFQVVAHHEGPAQMTTGRQAFIRLLSESYDAVVCTNNFLAQGFIDSIAEIDIPPIIAAFDEVPMMHLLPLPIVCSMQDVPALADGCVRQLLAQLRGDIQPIEPIVLDARIVINAAFRNRQSAIA